MKKISLLTKLFVLTAVMSVNAQINFEDLTMPTYKNGSNGMGHFISGDATFINYYNTTYNSWAGFAVSNGTNTYTSGFANQYSASAGEGANSSDNYMVSYVSSFSGATYIKLASSQIVTSVDVTNSTYAFNSMRDGDTYAKQFGGISGNDADFFILTVKGFNANVYTDSINFYLADYRDDNNANDYVVNSWETVDLTTLGNIDSLIFELSSTDNSELSMNTPAYFCVDDLTLSSGVLDFEEYDFDYWNGEDLTGNFTSEESEFGNTFTPGAYGGYWTGFAYSVKTDITTSGYLNQYSAITGSGNSSDIYGVGNGNPGMKLNEAVIINNIKITNSTYAHNSMRDGDMFAKQFGGVSGNDEDFFILTIKGYNTNIYTDSVNFYLADFRDVNNANDYIINTWENVDLSSLGEVDSVSFSLSSSDNGQFGMNTPAYFCIDDITLNSVDVANISTDHFNIYPNPANNYVNIEANNISEIKITNISGKIIYTNNVNNYKTQIDISNYKSGIYFILVTDNNSVYAQKLIKE